MNGLRPRLPTTLVAKQLGQQYNAPIRFRKMAFENDAVHHLPTALEIGLDPHRNPALTLLKKTCEELNAANPGSLEDVVAPADWMEDLVGAPSHMLFDLVDAVIVGDSEDALLSLCRGETTHPNIMWGHTPTAPQNARLRLKNWPPIHFDHVISSHHPYPKPVVDLRLGRGCSWGKCAFCAIQSHQQGYRSGDPEHVAASMLSAYETLGTTFFRIRDDLVTPPQLKRLAKAIRRLPFQPRWMVRGRFDRGFTKPTPSAVVVLLANALSIGEK